MNWHRLPCLVALTVVGLLGAAGLGWGQAGKAGGGAGKVAMLAAIEGPIGPAAGRHVKVAIEMAAKRGAEVLVLRLNTPGGLVTSMREIIADILASPVPVVGYVAPSGAHAASAGTYILYATHVAAMAPGTNLGAATPVQIGGGMPGLPKPGSPQRDRSREPDSGGAKDMPKAAPTIEGNPMPAKAINDAAAFIRSLAEIHGRNADWAEKAVREAASLSAQSALRLNVVDLIADDVTGLLAAINGRTVKVGGRQRTLVTKGLQVERIEPGLMTRLLAVISNPNVALILMMIGVYGLFFEFSNPGSIGPGVAGVICLLLGLYALNQLPLNYAGLALIGVGIAFMVAEAFTPTFGVLGFGGLVSFVIGAAMLIDTDVAAYQLSWWVIGTMAVISAAILVVLVGYLWRAQRRPTVDSVSRLVGMEAEVLDWAGAEGYVWAEGERWHARGSPGFSAGDTVRVRALDGLTLVLAPPAAAGPEADQLNPQQQGD